MSVFGLSVLLVIAVWLDTQRTHAYNLAQNMGGQAWYRIDLQGQHVGYMTTQSAQDVHGRLHFDNTTHFSVADGQPSTIIKRLTFAATPPHELRPIKKISPPTPPPRHPANISAPEPPPASLFTWEVMALALADWSAR